MDLVGTIKNSSSNQFSYARKSEFNQLKSKDEYINLVVDILEKIPSLVYNFINTYERMN